MHSFIFTLNKKPHIYYVIKEKVISWDINFEQEKDETDSKNDAVQFAYIKPETPILWDLNLADASARFHGMHCFRLQLKPKNAPWHPQWQPQLGQSRSI